MLKKFIEIKQDILNLKNSFQINLNEVEEQKTYLEDFQFKISFC